MTNNKKVVCTGAAGFIGHHLVKRLKELGFYVIGVDNFSTGNYDYREFCDFFIHKNINEITPIDLLDVDTVFHLAALPRVQLSIEQPELTNISNVHGTLRMLLKSTQAKVRRFVYSSSSSVYGIHDVFTLNESLPTRPLSPYAVQKLAAENYVSIWPKLYGLSTISLRYFNVYGEDQDGTHPYATAVAKFLQQKKEGKPLTIFGDGDQTRDMTYVGDVVEANIKAMDAVHEGPFNIAGGRSYRIKEVAEMIDNTFEFLPARNGEPRHTRGDITIAEEFLQWHPTMNLKEWINSQV